MDRSQFTTLIAACILASKVGDHQMPDDAAIKNALEAADHMLDRVETIYDTLRPRQPLNEQRAVDGEI
jgi:hypothetical protein